MRAILLLSVCGVGVWGAPTTVAPVTVPPSTSAPAKSAELSSATVNSNVTVAANATDVDKKIFPFNNQGFGLPFSGFQGPQGPFGNGFGLNPSLSPFQGNIYGQYPTGQNVFPQGLYTPQNQNPFYNQGVVQPAQVLGQPGQSPGTQGFQQIPLQPGQSPQGPIQQGQLPQGPFQQGQLPQGPFPQGQFPPNQFPQQQYPQNQFPQALPTPANGGNNDNGEGPSPQNPASAGNSNEQPPSENPAGSGGQKEQQDGPTDAQNPGGQANKPNLGDGAGQLPGQFAAGYQGFPQTPNGSPQFFRAGGPGLNQNFFSPTYQFLPSGQFLPQGFDGQLLTPGVFAGQGNGPTQLNPNQPQSPQGQGQFAQNPQGGLPQGAQGHQGPQGGFFPQGGFPPGFQGGYPQIPQGVFTPGLQGAYVPNPQGGFPQGAAPNQGPFQANPNGPVGPQSPGQNPQEGGAPGQGNPNQGPPSSSNTPDFQSGPNTQSRGVSQGDVTINGGIVSDAPVRPLEPFKLKRPIVLPAKINPVTSMQIIPPPGPNPQRPFQADQAPQPSQGSELRSPPGDLYNEVPAVKRPTKETEGTSNTDRPATRRPDP